MKQFLLLSLLFIVATLSGQDDRKVIIIGMDGTRTDALQLANTPNLDGLTAQAIYSYDALNDDITISGPGWSAILCGVWSPKHEVVNNDFSGNNYAQYPSLFQLAETYSPDIHTASFCHWGPINDFIIADAADFKINLSTDVDVAQQAVDYLTVNDPDLLFLHFDDIDHVGHGSGFSPQNPAYISAIETVDGLIGEVIQGIQNRPNYDQENWLVLVTTDHGGLGNSHGGNSPQEQNVFVIVSAPNLTPTELTPDSTWVDDSVVDCLAHEEVLTFAGDGSSVIIPTSPLLNFGSDQDFTIECRVRTSVSGDVAIVGNKDWDSGVNAGVVFSFRFPNGPEWKVNIGDGNNRADIDAGGLIADNEWHTLSVTFDRNETMKMYQDGVFFTETDISFIGDINTDVGLLFGADINSDYAYSGQLSEVRVWNKVLSATEINDWYCQSLNNTHSSYADLLGYWPLASAEDMIADFSENALNGNNQGAEWQSIDSILVLDYSSTPRLVDVPVTALQHLCIPIQETWNLDGESLIPTCNINAVDEVFNLAIQLSPNPLLDGLLQFENESNVVWKHLDIYRPDGQLVRSFPIENDSQIFDLQSLQAGLYIVVVKDNAQHKFVEKLIIF